jgi:hypothetical protein
MMNMDNSYPHLMGFLGKFSPFCEKCFEKNFGHKLFFNSKKEYLKKKTPQLFTI